ncbi:Segregation and condensation protein A [Gluconacetobacter sp. SXCC-1]|uniref:Segregation and condensation protein A n=1 Tax=Komagataeibacter rhaeticus TaxID=215221 RepID=A0A858JLP9_9PROT|nr:ScpA family protein [Komagataeibacter rhaeticus]ATU73531.1 segregation/condensation protein A [Komagataeibacter xylinus]EGG75846.1 Segregation and condensation protein A [Gluconacetobacter sp. SXCC-1]QIP34637.1 segregation/condensation protein A [Komagataeibacter rhaeticus]QOC47158.1 segregation/condensation protein A [Komagataeibacter rhaeticus]WPP20504.1 ScpA family protein [Komagataeibacter rhaeticus]
MTRDHPPRPGPAGGGDASAAPAAPASAPIVHLEGFEGPMDLLLELARAQKVDLWRISILQLVEQYLAVVRAAPGVVRLEQAADWLVMAAWLAWLKSRLLLPDDDEEATDAEEAAALLHERLLELERMVQLGRWLGARAQLGFDVFERGQAESLVAVDRSGLAVDVPQLMRGYMAAMRRRARRHVYQPRVLRFWTVQDALGRLGRMLGTHDARARWCGLEHFLPPALPPQPDMTDTMVRTGRRAAVAGTLLASLEMARNGTIELQQDEQFGRILLRERMDGKRHGHNPERTWPDDR